RLDCFVNLFQIGVETLLFYHPAVWWVSQRIRTEREHCCDDEAVGVCGDAVNYARALTLMEEWRTSPSLVMAANRSPLSPRVVRPAKHSTYTKSFASRAQAGQEKDKDKIQKANGQTANKESYLDAMEAAVFKNLSADELIAMKVQGVTPAYVREIHDLGMKPTPEEFIGMRVEGITPEYIREMRSIAPNPNIDELMGMKVQGI